MKSDDKLFKWTVTVFILGSCAFCLGSAIYYSYFWESNEFLSSFTRTENVWLSLGGFGFFGMLSNFLIDVWDE